MVFEHERAYWSEPENFTAKEYRDLEETGLLPVAFLDELLAQPDLPFGTPPRDLLDQAADRIIAAVNEVLGPDEGP